MIINRQRRFSLPESRIRALAGLVMKDISIPETSLGICFTNDAGIRRYNRAFTGKRNATDVLAFPTESSTSPPTILQDGAPGPASADHSYGNPGEEGCLGDIIISCETAHRNSMAIGNPFEREIGLLVIHGILHLAGYDHTRDEGEMEQIQNRLLEKHLDKKGHLKNRAYERTGTPKPTASRTKTTAGGRMGKAKQ